MRLSKKTGQGQLSKNALNPFDCIGLNCPMPLGQLFSCVVTCWYDTVYEITKNGTTTLILGQLTEK